ncbi:hypothetical protein BTVI_64585 [Pitangus sulphuratus]|nr:hypothetical protein BTVI_64585 [Pitangus sulphuratus]
MRMGKGLDLKPCEDTEGTWCVQLDKSDRATPVQAMGRSFVDPDGTPSLIHALCLQKCNNGIAPVESETGINKGYICISRTQILKSVETGYSVLAAFFTHLFNVENHFPFKFWNDLTLLGQTCPKFDSGLRVSIDLLIDLKWPGAEKANFGCISSSPFHYSSTQREMPPTPRNDSVPKVDNDTSKRWPQKEDGKGYDSVRVISKKFSRAIQAPRGEEADDTPALEVFKARLDRAWSSLGQWKVSLPMARSGIK